MKYLDTYKIFENSDYTEIKDILLPLKQDGFTIKINHVNIKITNIIILKRETPFKFIGFNYYEIGDCVNHFLSYAFSKEYKIDHIRILYFNKTPNNIFSIDDIDKDKKLSELSIYLK